MHHPLSLQILSTAEMLTEASPLSPPGPTQENQAHLADQGSVPRIASQPESAVQANLLQLELPPSEMIWQLVRFHERSLLWYHGCYHGPTLRDQLQCHVDTQTDTITASSDYQWTALLFAILAGSLICANDRQLMEWRFRKSDVAKQATRWYKASIICLDRADYAANHSLDAVQAIATLTVSAHSLGFSNKQSVLLGAALKISQSLGIHKLVKNASIDSITPFSTIEDKRRILDREIRRRLWSQICVQDWFCVPSTEACNINPLFATSVKPSNRDFLTMEHVPDDIPTYVSYGNYLNDIARLIAGLQEALASSHTPLTQYERVMEFDAEMRDLATKGRPIYFDVTQPLDRDWQDFVPWARRSLTICFSHKSTCTALLSCFSKDDDLVRACFARSWFTANAIVSVAHSFLKILLNSTYLDCSHDDPQDILDSKLYQLYFRLHSKHVHCCCQDHYQRSETR
jgi:hypothetical protein